MIEIINRATYKARKEYRDDAWEFIREWISSGCPVYYGKKHLEFKEARLLVYYKNNPKIASKILPGQQYERQFNKYDGEVYTWRTKKEFFDLACKYDLFPDY
jgi:hypothetical protein